MHKHNSETRGSGRIPHQGQKTSTVQRIVSSEGDLRGKRRIDEKPSVFVREGDTRTGRRVLGKGENYPPYLHIPSRQ